VNAYAPRGIRDLLLVTDGRRGSFIEKYSKTPVEGSVWYYKINQYRSFAIINYPRVCTEGGIIFHGSVAEVCEVILDLGEKEQNS
jgi:hypothetical protein